MITCKECKWWKREVGRDPSWSHENANSHIESYEDARKFRAEHGYSFYGECESPKFFPDSIPIASDGLSYSAEDDYRSFFQTGQDFGCIHGEYKPSEPDPGFEKFLDRTTEHID